MATKQHSKATKKQAPQHSAATAPNPPLTVEQKAAKFDELMASYGEAIRAGEAPTKRKPEGLRLAEREAQKLGFKLNDLASKFAAIHRIAWHMEDLDRDERNAAATAVNAMSQLGAMEADAITRSMGLMEAGFFGDEVAFLTSGRAKQ
jgi:hypothetical protein